MSIRVQRHGEVSVVTIDRPERRNAVDGVASFGVLNRRFGVPLIDMGSVRLPRLIGTAARWI